MACASSAPAWNSTRRSTPSATPPSAAANSSSSTTCCRCGTGSSASRASTTSCAPPSPTAPTCRAFRRSGSAAASTTATPTGSPASTCCTPSHRTTSRDVETPTAGYNLLRAEISYTTKLARSDWLGRAASSPFGLVGNNLLNEDIRNAVVLQQGSGAAARPWRAHVREREVLSDLTTWSSPRKRGPITIDISALQRGATSCAQTPPLGSMGPRFRGDDTIVAIVSIGYSARANVQSGRTAPLTPSNAPSATSQTSSRAGSTGPGIVACPFGMRLKPTRL